MRSPAPFQTGFFVLDGARYDIEGNEYDGYLRVDLFWDNGTEWFLYGLLDKDDKKPMWRVYLAHFNGDQLWHSLVGSAYDLRSLTAVFKSAVSDFFKGDFEAQDFRNAYNAPDETIKQRLRL